MTPIKRTSRKSSRSKTARTTTSQLNRYHAKRDFTKTAEPSGGATRRKSQRTTASRLAIQPLEFVIQKHAASHLHFDLRLELDGVMKSWAVPKGPSVDPSVKRLAMQVEDHPMEYNTFEGTIPKGQYGGGTVMVWDRGVYAPDEKREDESSEDAVRRGLEAGKLAFTFLGKRVKGSFALVRTSRGGEEKPQWLLIKHDDKYARPGKDIVATQKRSVDTGRKMEEIAAESDKG